jgi:hypothetical protein
LHYDLPFGRTNAPSPNTATLFQQGFKDRQLMRRHSGPSFALGNESSDLPEGSTI